MSTDTDNSNWGDNATPCPECGATAEHYATCSHGPDLEDVCDRCGKPLGKPDDTGLWVCKDCIGAALAQQSPREAELIEVLQALFEWELMMGGWEAPCWKRAHEVLARSRIPERPSH